MRDKNGRFLPGESGNPRGRLPGSKGYLDILREVCTPDRWRAVCVKAVEQAEKGDKAARAFVANYLLGKPIEFIHQEVVGDVMTLDAWRLLAAERRKGIEDD